MSNTYVNAMIAVMAIVTMLLRFLPFMIFGERKTPKYIDYLGKYLPYAIMGMLVVYCLKGITSREHRLEFLKSWLLPLPQGSTYGSVIHLSVLSAAQYAICC